MRYAGEESPFSYKNCTVAELGGEVVGMLHAFPIEEPEQEGASEVVDPILEPYARLEVPGSYYVNVHRSPTEMGTIIACGNLAIGGS